MSWRCPTLWKCTYISRYRLGGMICKFRTEFFRFSRILSSLSPFPRKKKIPIPLRRNRNNLSNSDRHTFYRLILLKNRLLQITLSGIFHFFLFFCKNTEFYIYIYYLYKSFAVFFFFFLFFFFFFWKTIRYVLACEPMNLPSIDSKFIGYLFHGSLLSLIKGELKTQNC